MFDAVGPDRSLGLIVSTVGPTDTAEPFMPGRSLQDGLHLLLLTRVATSW